MDKFICQLHRNSSLREVAPEESAKRTKWTAGNRHNHDLGPVRGHGRGRDYIHIHGKMSHRHQNECVDQHQRRSNHTNQNQVVQREQTISTYDEYDDILRFRITTQRYCIPIKKQE